MDGKKKYGNGLYEIKKSQQIILNKASCTLLHKEETMNTWTKTGMVDKPPLGRARFVLSQCLGWKLELLGNKEASVLRVAESIFV